MIFKNYLETFKEILKSLVILDNNGNILSENSVWSIISRKLNETKDKNGVIYLVGNGGSSGIVSHASVDFLNTCKIKAIPLTDSSQLTCFANDYGYENVFAKPLDNLILQNDILIAVSSSGSSKNIINAVEVARSKGAFILTLSGFEPDNPLKQLGDLNYWLNSNHYGMIEIGHSLILHFIADKFSNKIF